MGIDTDCSPTCGDGVVDANETCDTGIAPGVAGSCPTKCIPSSACEDAKLVSGNTCSAVCVRYQIVEQTGKLLTVAAHRAPPTPSTATARRRAAMA